MPTEENFGPIKEAEAIELIEYAYEHGVNYFDTAFFYHSGKSEQLIGKALAKYPRDTWYLADKMPGNMMDVVDGKLKLDLSGMNMGDLLFDSPAEIFELQLKNCGVDYFDFYLLHNVCESTYELYSDEKIGFISYLLEQKKNGRIRHFGFSSHANPDTIGAFLDRYDCFEFAQIQINYLDWTLQKAGEFYDILTKHNIPVIAMEPVRGGKLANPGEKETAMLKAVRPDDTPAAWAFRFLQSLPNMPVILSGMTTMEHLRENIELFSKNDPVTESDKALLQQVVESIADFVPCTSCRYCCDSCPQKLDIPLLISTYNEAAVEIAWIVNSTLGSLAEDKKPQACVGCGVCSPLCPQNIDIPDIMAKFVALLGSGK